MARPTKLTEARHKAIVKAIRDGNYAQVAAAANGITEQTYYNWINRGMADSVNGTASIYQRFFEAVKTAEAGAEVRRMTRMQSDDKWQRHAWWLERRFPKRWGQKQALELSGPDGGPVEVETSVADLEAFLDDRKDQIAAAQAALADVKADEGE